MTLGLFLLGAGSCNAHINHFETSEHHVCPGYPVKIVWDVTGAPILTIRPPIVGAPNGSVDARGEATIAPARDTRVSLRVTRCLGEPTGADIDLVVPGGVAVAATLDDSGRCDGKVLTLHDEVKNFDANVLTDLVGLESSEHRGVDVTRADSSGHSLTVHVEPGKWSGAFAALPVNGAWTLSSALAPGESCRTRHTLTVYVQTACKGGTP